MMRFPELGRHCHLVWARVRSYARRTSLIERSVIGRPHDTDDREVVDGAAGIGDAAVDFVELIDAECADREGRPDRQSELIDERFVDYNLIFAGLRLSTLDQLRGGIGNTKVEHRSVD